ncbi:MAG: hypothetical protein K2K28_00640, partial [Clostridia bacterium]|nr:hypothetical protein [Clostridia bacterium]
IVCGAILGAILLSCLAVQIGHWVSDGIQSWRPDYEQIEIMPILNKAELTEEDYGILYKQTGLTKVGIDRALAKGKEGKQRILKIQQDFFGEYVIANETFAPWFCTDYIEGHKHISTVYLENSDIFVTSSTHFSSCRIGHAGLVTDAKYGNVLQANSYSQPSKIGKTSDFTDRVNFMILRVKEEYADKNLREEIAEYAKHNLIGIPYNGACGVLTDKNSLEATQCAHIVWYAFKQFGIDIDANAGKVVSPWNIANSDKLELVQTFGFDITDKEGLWPKLNY